MTPLPPVFAVGPMSGTDPFGPVEIDPDDARDVACDVTESASTCEIPEPRDLDDVTGGGGGSVGGAGAGFGGTLLVVALVVLLVAGLGWLATQWWRGRPAEDEEDEGDLDEDLDGRVDGADGADRRRIIDAERPPDRWRRRAAEHRDRAEFRDAIRCEYRALVGDLARAGFVDEIPGRTSGEERVQVAELAPEVAPSFDAAADLFDRAWFDDGEVTAADDERFVGSAEDVLAPLLATRAGRP